jgi:hypothetical protein
MYKFPNCYLNNRKKYILSKYVFYRIGGNHPQHALSFTVYKILKTYLCCYNMILLFVKRTFTLPHEFRKSISFSKKKLISVSDMCYIHPRKATAEIFVDVIVQVIRPTLIYVRTVPSRLYIKAYAGIKVHI